MTVIKTNEHTGEDSDGGADEAGSFFNPMAPIASARTAKGRIRLAALVSAVMFISAAFTLGDALRTLFGDRSDAGAVAPDIVLAAMLTYVVLVTPVTAIIMVFAQRLWVIGLFVSAGAIWVGMRLVLTFQQLDDAQSVIVGTGNFVLACAVALTLVHAMRSALVLYALREHEAG